MMPSCARTISLVLLTLAMPLATTAQEPPEVEVDRPATEILDDLRPDADRDSVDTAILFTNVRATNAVVRCSAYDHEGELIGRTITRVPPLGLRFVRGSDLSGGADFLGQARCSSAQGILVSAILAAPAGLSDLPVRNVDLDGTNSYRLPVVTSF